MVKWNATPLEEINGVKFGMPRSKVREVLGGTYREFKKGKFSTTTTDDFGICHVFYNRDDKCEAVEVFEECEVSVGGKVIFPLAIPSVEKLIPDLEEDTGSYISKKLSVGIYAPDGKPESILFGEAGYYES